MSFLNQMKIDEVKGKLTNDLSVLGKLYQAKKNGYQRRSVDHSLVDDLLKEGWEEDGKPLKTKTKMNYPGAEPTRYQERF